MFLDWQVGRTGVGVGVGLQAPVWLEMFCYRSKPLNREVGSPRAQGGGLPQHLMGSWPLTKGCGPQAPYLLQGFRKPIL